MKKEIRYSRDTKDFEVIVDGRTIAFAQNYLDGERIADEYVYDCLSRDAAVLAIIKAQKSGTNLAHCRTERTQPERTEVERLRATEPEEKQGVCARCGRARTVYKTNAVADWGADVLELEYVCGACQHRGMRRTNTQEMYGKGRKGY